MADLGQVFEEAKKAEKEVSSLSISKRIGFISALKQTILGSFESVIDQIQKDTGKSRSDALMSEIFPVLDHLAYLEKNAEKIIGDRKVPTPIALMGKKSVIFFEPLGTVLVISPWNYPFYQSIVPCTLSFILGNATLYKPSEHTPLENLVEPLLSQAGFKPNWIQVVYGDGSVGSELIKLRPDKIFFTGSATTGSKIMRQASTELIPVELELGGKDPMIVFEDADIERATSGALWGAMTNAGQSCTSVERLYVHRKIYDRFKEKLVQKAQALKLGVDSDGDADFGKMTTDFQVETVAGHVRDAVEKGATFLSGNEWDQKSSMIPPILLERVRPDTKIMNQETFGPTLPLVSFETEDEVVGMANDSEFGLSASVWTADAARALRVSRGLKTGNISINNVMLSEGNHYLPFGGVKKSGFGRYKGEFGFYSFANIKSVLIDSNSSKIEANWYPYTKKKYLLFSEMMRGLFKGGVAAFLRFLIAGLKLESYSNKIGKSGRV